MVPPRALSCHLDGGAAPEPPDSDRQDFVRAAGGAVTFIGQDGGDFVVGDAVPGKTKQALAHLRAARELVNGVDAHLHLEFGHGTAAPDDSDQGDIALATVEHDLIDKAAEQRLAVRVRSGLVRPDQRQATGQADDLVC